MYTKDKKNLVSCTLRGHHVNEEVMYEELMYKEKNPPINRENRTVDRRQGYVSLKTLAPLLKTMQE